jgi:hypothetical protein
MGCEVVTALEAHSEKKSSRRDRVKASRADAAAAEAMEQD